MTIQTNRINNKAYLAARFIITLGVILCLVSPAQAGFFRDAANHVRQKVTNVVGEVQKRVENREGALRRLVDEVDPTKLIELIQMTKTAIEFVIAEKQKLDDWQSRGGGEASRRKITQMINDIAVAEKNVHALSCAVAPFRPPFSESKQRRRVGFLKTLLGATPKPLLWAADTAFSAALGDNWGGMIGEVNDKVSPIADGIGVLCDVSDQLNDPALIEVARCEIMRNPAFDDIGDIENYVDVTKNLIDFTNHFVKDDIVVTVGVTVAAGGAAGTNIKNPIKPMLSGASSELAKVQKVLGKINKQRESCDKRDEKIERDLMSCNALVSYDTDDYIFVQDLARRRYDEIYANGMNQSNIPWSSFEGRSFFDVCSQYQDLRFGPE
jgi:hypothetical protein